MKIDISIPFSLAYIDWAKEVKSATTLEQTERHDWVMEYGRIFSDAGGEVTGADIFSAKGFK